MKIIVLDVEATGLDTVHDQVCEVSIAEGLEHDAPVNTWRIKPQRPMQPDAVACHGITDEMLADAPLFAEVAVKIFPYIQNADVIVGYNPGYDIAILKAEFERVSVRLNWPKVVIDAKRLWDIYEPPVSRNLQNAFKHFVNSDGFEGHHGSAADVRATARVVYAQSITYDLNEKPMHEWDIETASWWGGSHHFIWDEDRTKLVCNFGKHDGVDAVDLNGGFLTWMMGKDFPPHVKDLIAVLRECWKRNNSRSKSEQNNYVAEWARHYQ